MYQNSTNPNICYDESESVTETEQSMEDIQLWARNFTVDKTPTKKGQNGEQGFADVTSFGVLLAIERAMHLPMVTERNRFVIVCISLKQFVKQIVLYFL